jgi:cysteine-rich repeat protein
MARLAWILVVAAPTVAACSILNAPDEVESGVGTGGGSSSSTGDPQGGSGGSGASGSSTGGSGGTGGAPPAECQNGVLEAGEDCDDGNDETGDACSPQCAITQFDVEVDPTLGNEWPGVGTIGNGGFYVAWRWRGVPVYEIRGRAFSKTGKRLQANALKLSNGNPGQSRVGTNPDGRSIVAFQNFDSTLVAYHVVEPDGVPAPGGEKTINLSTADSLISVGANDDGRFALTWYQYNSGLAITECMVRTFDASGSLFDTGPTKSLGTVAGGGYPGVWGLKDTFVVSFDTPGGNLGSWMIDGLGISQDPPGIFETGNGGDVQPNLNPQGVWVGPDNQYIAVFEQHRTINGAGKQRILKAPFDAPGDAADLSTLVSSEHRRELNSRVARHQSGRFIVVWVDEDPLDTLPENGARIMARIFQPNGNPAGQEVQVSEDSKGFQTWPGVAVNADGDAMIVWDSNGGDDPVPTGEPFKISGKIYPRLLAGN